MTLPPPPPTLPTPIQIPKAANAQGTQTATRTRTVEKRGTGTTVTDTMAMTMTTGIPTPTGAEGRERGGGNASRVRMHMRRCRGMISPVRMGVRVMGRGQTRRVGRSVREGFLGAEELRGLGYWWLWLHGLEKVTVLHGRRMAACLWAQKIHEGLRVGLWG